MVTGAATGRLMDSPIKWMGGKRRLSARIARLLPTDAECYVEAFAGAALALFAKRPHPIEVINDANGDLANLWRVMRDRGPEFLDRVQCELYSRERFEELKRTDPATLDDLERANWLYLLIQMAFGADLSDVRTASFGHWKTGPQNLFLTNSRVQFPAATARLSNVIVESDDFGAVIGRYDGPGTIHFCDPPYLGQKGYAVLFGRDDHERLAAALARIEGRFLLTVNDSPETRALYCRREWFVEKASEPRGASRMTRGRQPAPILMIANYPINHSLWGADWRDDDEDEEEGGEDEDGL